MVQQIVKLRDEVRDRTTVDLPDIAADPSVTCDGLTRCIRAAVDFDSIVNAVGG